MSKNVPNFHFHTETITNISELQPTNILMVSSGPTRATPSIGTSLRSTTMLTSSTRAAETKENNGIFKRNITADPRRRLVSPAVASDTATTTATKNDPNMTPDTTLTGSGEDDGSVGAESSGDPVGQAASPPPRSSPESSPEIKFCFLQRTVTLASASVAVVLVLSLVLVSFSVMTHCRQKRRRDRVAILDDLQ